MRYAVIDLETTGFHPREDRVVEMACVLVEGTRIVHSWSTHVDPQRPIPEYATRVHGITDDAVRGAPLFALAQRRLRAMCMGATVVAHNARFDLSFLPELHEHPALCTLQLARQCFPGAPDHKCQTLRRYLGIDAMLQRGLVPHRALDALVTAGILIRCLHGFPGALSA